jgi:hypothetical protein
VIVDTETDGWQRVSGSLGWRKSLRDRHWAQITRDQLGWSWVILKVDKTTMCPVGVADGMDITLSAAKDDVDHWNDNYHRHAVVVRRVWYGGEKRWWALCRTHRCWFSDDEHIHDLAAACDFAAGIHRDCEAAWQRGER